MEQTKPTSLWKNKDFVILWSGQLVSVIGSNITSIAAPLLVLFLTNSPAQTGLAYLFMTLPTFLFGLPAGVLVDRWDRKKVMILCDLGRMVLMTSIPLAALLGHLSVPLIFAVLFIAGIFEVFFSVSQIAALLHVVEKEQLSTALAYNDAALSTGSLIGPSLGGAIYQTLGKTIPFLLDALSYAVSVVSLLFVKVSFQKEKIAEEKKFLNEMKDGLAFLWKAPIIRFLAFITSGGAIAGIAQNIIVILLAKKLGANAFDIGLIGSMGAIGALLGTVVAARIQKLFSLHSIIVTGRWIFVGTYASYLFASHFWIIGIILFVYSFFSVSYGNSLGTYRISQTPDHLQGRVTSVFRLILYAGLVIGSALGGILLQITNLQTTILAFVVLLFFLAILTTFNKDLIGYKKL